MTGDSLPFFSLPFSESLVRSFLSSIVQDEQLDNEAHDIANILGIQRRPEKKTVTTERPNICQVPKIKDEDKNSGHNFILQPQSVQIKKEMIQAQDQASQENESKDTYQSIQILKI